MRIFFIFFEGNSKESNDDGSNFFSILVAEIKQISVPIHQNK